jgi:8-amino-3,8-dideoxy-alpha-D-manno-octulosonate transaminase
MSSVVSEHDLAINGGRPARTRANPQMFPGGLAVGAEEKELVDRVIDSKYLFRYYGPAMGIEQHQSMAEIFEREFAERIQVNHALGVNSCTSALVTALYAAGIGPGDEVIVPAYTFYATCSAVVAVGAIPRVADIDDTLTVDPKSVESLVNDRTKGIVAVHMRGVPCDMDSLSAIARDHNLFLMEDVAQAVGGSYHGKPLGSIGDIAAFSLQYHKIITAGEGGVVTTNNDQLYERALWAHDSAACWRPNRFESAEEPGKIFHGFNFRMSELTGAVALAQVRKLDDLLAQMRKAKSRIMDNIADIPNLRTRRINDTAGDTGISVFLLLPDVDTTKRFAEALKAEGVSAGTAYDRSVPDWHVFYHWDQLIQKSSPFPSGFPYTYHEQLTGEKLEYDRSQCPNCEDYLGRAVTFDVPPALTGDDCDEIGAAIHKVASVYLPEEGQI